MTVIRNLTVSDIVLNDLEGIVISALSDYNLNEESLKNIINSNDLVTQITAGNIVFVDTEGNVLSQLDSLGMKNSMSVNQPALFIHDNGVPSVGGSHDVINFVGSSVSLSSINNKVDLSLLPGLEFNIIGGEQFLTLPDPSRGNVKLSVEKLRYMFIHDSPTDNSNLWIMDLTTANNSYAIPFNAKIVAVSATTEIGPDTNVTLEYDLYVNGSLFVSSVISTFDDIANNIYDDSLDIDLNFNDIIRMKTNLTSGAGSQSGLSVVLYLRWRV